MEDRLSGRVLASFAEVLFHDQVIHASNIDVAHHSRSLLLGI